MIGDFSGSWMVEFVDDDPASTLWKPGSVEFLAQEMPEEIPVEVPKQVALPQMPLETMVGYTVLPRKTNLGTP